MLHLPVAGRRKKRPGYDAAIDKGEKGGVTVDWSRVPYFDSAAVRRKDANSDQWLTLPVPAGASAHFDAGDIPSCTYEITLSAAGQESRAVTLKATYKK